MFLVAAPRPAIVRLKNDQSILRNRIGFVPVSIRIIQGIEQVAEMGVDPGDHGAPLLGLGGQLLKVGLILVSLIPIGELLDFLEGSMWDLCRE